MLVHTFLLIMQFIHVHIHTFEFSSTFYRQLLITYFKFVYVVVYYSDNEDNVLRKGDPANISQTYGSVVLCQKEDTLHLSIYKGFHFEVESIEYGLTRC